VNNFNSRNYSHNTKSIKIYKDLSNKETIKSIKKENKQKIGVYGFYNNINGKIYIGSSKNISKRFNEHMRLGEDNTKSNKKLQRSILKHGLENFDFLIFVYSENFNFDLLMNLETTILQSFDKSYLLNFNTVALSFNWDKIKFPRTGKKHSKETKEKIRKSLLSLPDEKKNLIVSKETRDKISKFYSTGDIEIYDINNNLLAVFNSSRKVGQFCNMAKSTVLKYLKTGKIYKNKFYFIKLDKINDLSN